MPSQCSQNSSKTGQGKETSRKLAPKEEQRNQWRNKIAGASTWIGQFLCGLLTTFLIHSRRQSGACRRHVPPRTGHLSRPMGVAGLLSAGNKGLTRIETNSLPAPGKKLPDLGGMIVGLTYSLSSACPTIGGGIQGPSWEEWEGKPYFLWKSLLLSKFSSPHQLCFRFQI